MGFLSAVPLIGSGIQALGDWITGKSANDSNRELAELSYQRQREMFDYSNAYNSPAAQMKRFQEAGLNPNLIYGQSANTAVSAPKYEPPKIERVSPRVDNLAQNMLMSLTMKKQEAEIQNVQANTELTKEKKRTEQILQGVRDVTGKKLAYDLDLSKTLGDYNVSIKKSESEKASQEVVRLQQEIKNMSKDEALKTLQATYQQNAISQQEVEKEIKQAQLLFQNQQNAMRAMGINDGDDPRLRILVKALESMGVNPYQLLNQGYQKLKDLFNR